MNILFQNALSRKVQNTPPIWFMRQAGRYHSHYQGLRSKNSFDELCKIPELASEVALGPIMDFDFDVAILFSDILYPLQALGMGLDYTDQGPKLSHSLTQENIKHLKPVDEAIAFMSFQKAAMKLTREKLPKNKSLIGFVGGLWTLFVYSVEGHHSGSLISSKTQPQLFAHFSEIMLNFLTRNIELQFEGGAEVVMIFDTAAGEVSPSFFKRYLQPNLEVLAQRFPNKIGYYSKSTQSSFFDNDFKNLPWAGLGFDHRWNTTDILINNKVGFTQGNFDQALLHLDKDNFKKELNTYIQPLKALDAKDRAGWVCGLGHGVLPKTPEANVKTFIETIRKEF